MKPIFYRNKKTGECFRVKLDDDLHNDQIDPCLDVIGNKENEFITESEFWNSFVMEVDIYDTDNRYKIGVLTTKKLDVQYMTDEEGELI